MNHDALVVLVDDTVEIRRLFERRLGAWYRVRAFASAEELLAEVATLHPSLFVLDWMLPDLDGIALCRRLRSELAFDPVPIAIFTGVDPSAENVRAATEAGANAFIQKGSDGEIAISQMRALAEGYRRLARYMRSQAAVMSALRHDIANWLTGISTTAELLAPEVADLPLAAEDVETIRASSRQLVPLLGDLGEMLALDRGLELERAEPFEIAELIAEARGFLRDCRLEVAYPEAKSVSTVGSRRALARVLHYLVRLVESRVPPGGAVEVIASPDPGGLRLGVSFPGDQAAALSALFARERLDEEPARRKDLLPVEYVRRILRLHGSKLEVGGEGGRTVLAFRLAVGSATS